MMFMAVMADWVICAFVVVVIVVLIWASLDRLALKVEGFNDDVLIPYTVRDLLAIKGIPTILSGVDSTYISFLVKRIRDGSRELPTDRLNIPRVSKMGRIDKDTLGLIDYITKLKRSKTVIPQHFFGDEVLTNKKLFEFNLKTLKKEYGFTDMYLRDAVLFYGLIMARTILLNKESNEKIVYIMKGTF
jgi:hypothetical protein